MVEIIGGKEVIDVQPKKIEIEPMLESMYFTVTLVTPEKPVHILIKATSAIEALEFVQREEKAPAVAVHVTEYTKYYDATDPKYIIKEKSEGGKNEEENKGEVNV